MKCLICNSDSHKLFSGVVLKKYEIKYYKCENCGFIHTETPFWLEEAYLNAIADLDVGLISRNLYVASHVERVILKNFNYTKPFLDYAGGYGLFVRMMRDKGFDFYRQDKYCDNLFSQHFDINDIKISRFELLTAFEIFEHLEKPVEELEKMLNYSDSVLFSTNIVPNETLDSLDDWWYFSPESGQHISFYTIESLEELSSKLGCNFYSNNTNLHLITRKKMKKNPFHISLMDVEYRILPFIKKIIKKGKNNIVSKTQMDYEMIKSKL